VNTQAPSDTTEDLDRHQSQRGQGMIEYAFILILVAILLILAVQVLGHQTTQLYSNVSNGLAP
jgi:Flp pilus assembly pilin Flp